MYPLYVPSPIVFSGIYLVGFQYMEEEARRFFLSDADDDDIRWARRGFTEVYNRHFADEDHFFTSSEKEDHIDAQLPAMIQTIAIVGDDELELSWEEFVEFQTGFRVPQPGAEVLSFRIGRMGRASQGFVENNAQYTHFTKMMKHSISKNHLAGQGGVLCHIVGNWGNPLIQDEEAGTNFDVDKLTNRDDWIIRPLDEDVSEIGQLSSSEAAINLFEGGDIYAPSEVNSLRDPDTYGGGAETAEIDESAASETATESTVFETWAESWMGVSVLTDINFF